MLGVMELQTISLGQVGGSGSHFKTIKGFGMFEYTRFYPLFWPSVIYYFFQ